ncbi:ribonuclease H-like domain-containing protein, partial [Tanacetum coccineum]
MHTMFCDLGIVHQTSCAHTPQQNEIAERKHRHLLNVARSLMFQGRIPLRFCPNDDRNDTSVEDGCMQPSFDTADSAQGMYQCPTQMVNNIDDVQTPRLGRSTRQSKLPVKLNDYVLSSNVKYGIEKYVNYSKLKGDNLWFATTLNKYVEPICLSDALSDSNWVE